METKWGIQLTGWGLVAETHGWGHVVETCFTVMKSILPTTSCDMKDYLMFWVLWIVSVEQALVWGHESYWLKYSCSGTFCWMSWLSQFIYLVDIIEKIGEIDCRLPFIWFWFTELIWSCNFRELLIDFYVSSGNRRPDNIIIFRYVLFLVYMTQILLVQKIWSVDISSENRNMFPPVLIKESSYNFFLSPARCLCTHLHSPGGLYPNICPGWANLSSEVLVCIWRFD